jgi:FixJ family two-component response regulator
LKGGVIDHSRVAASTLTAREREIVQLLAEGETNKEIAELLDIKHAPLSGFVLRSAPLQILRRSGRFRSV